MKNTRAIFLSKLLELADKNVIVEHGVFLEWFVRPDAMTKLKIVTYS